MVRKHRGNNHKGRNRSKSNWYSIEENNESYNGDQRNESKKFFANYSDQQSQNESSRLKLNKQPVILTPRSENQRNYINFIQDPNTYITFGVGPAGTGKTMLATQIAIDNLLKGKVDKIVISRPNVACDEQDIGFLPGNIQGKCVPWLLPILDVFKEYYSPNEIKKMMNDEIIDIVPIAFIRGRTFKRSFIIIDEAQGTTPNSLLAILTRIGEGSRMIVTGDLRQTDHKKKNGLEDFLERYSRNHINGVEVVEFDNNDIQRHPVLVGILNLYEDLEMATTQKFSLETI